MESLACNAGVFWGRASAKISVNRGRHVGFAKLGAIAFARPQNTPALQARNLKHPDT